MGPISIRIDPHAHTLHSDGTDSPTALIKAARNAGLDVVGITDHDTFAGWAEAADAASRHGVGLIRGAEISTSLNGQSIHVLGLLMRPEGSELARRLKEVRQDRSERLRQMTSRISADYPRVTWDAIQASAAAAPLGRPHLADELVRQGYFPDRSSVFEEVLSPSGPYYLPQHALDPIEAVGLIRAAGGVPILAHPFATKRGKTVPRELIAQMAEAGLFGIERDHRDHNPEARQQVERIARDLTLRLSGGSDYHGLGKPNKLGENLLQPYILAEIEEQGELEVIRA